MGLVEVDSVDHTHECLAVGAMVVVVAVHLPPYLFQLVQAFYSTVRTYF